MKCIAHWIPEQVQGKLQDRKITIVAAPNSLTNVVFTTAAIITIVVSEESRRVHEEGIDETGPSATAHFVATALSYAINGKSNGWDRQGDRALIPIVVLVGIVLVFVVIVWVAHLCAPTAETKKADE